MTMTLSAPATGTGALELPTGTARPVPADEFRYGTPVKIAPEARDISGSALGYDELTGTVQGITEHPQSGERFYRIGTEAGTDIVVHTCFVSQVHDLVPVRWSVEVHGSFGWEQVGGLRGPSPKHTTRIRPTQDALDAFVIRQAAKARLNHRSVRVTAATFDGKLVAWHEEPGSKMPADPRNPRYPALLVLISGAARWVTFGSPQARLVGALALADDPIVASVDPDPLPAG